VRTHVVHATPRPLVLSGAPVQLRYESAAPTPARRRAVPGLLRDLGKGVIVSSLIALLRWLGLLP
jgi:hypothetical protein